MKCYVDKMGLVLITDKFKHILTLNLSKEQSDLINKLENIN